jgi:DNA segregation ATPase FtsK/SpoIIIE, S-DNA-T family
MAQKKDRSRTEKIDSKSSSDKKQTNIFGYTSDETIQGIFAVAFFVFGTLFTLAEFGRAGWVGENVFGIFVFLLGGGYFLLPLLFFTLSVIYFRNIKQRFGYGKIISALCALFSSLGIIETIWNDSLYTTNTGTSVHIGGFIGHIIYAPLFKLFQFDATLVILAGILVISLLLTFEASLNAELVTSWKRLFGKNKDKNDEADERAPIDQESSSRALKIVGADYKQADDEPTEKVKPTRKRTQKEETPAPDEEPSSEEGGTDTTDVDRAAGIAMASERKERESASSRSNKLSKEAFVSPYTPEHYIPIPLSLLEEDKGKPGVGDIKANANIIKRTLQNFGISVEMDEISIGPSVTRYALKPAEGVKLSRIVTLQNDLALALAAQSIRIEAPIPGKSLVGIEVPNTAKTTVGLAGLLGSDEFQQSDKPLLFALGKGVSGKLHFANLAKMPHLLIAGATGSGKSVAIHIIITSLLYRNSPQNLKFIMIDPKRVELTLYNKIPHLLTPVITDAKKAILSLKWAAKEMDRRYDILETYSVRDIQSYHKNILEPAMKKAAERGQKDEGEPITIPETMPYIVIVIDELADIMQSYPRELEAAIVRLAQMSRAVGIHLMLSTQRPSVNVITGLIKANIPARVALQVASQIDSRTILDMAGAENLLGAGDLLFMSADMAKPVRIQSAFISETELKKVVKFLVDSYITEIPSDITMTDPTNGANGESGKNSIFDALNGSVGDDTAGNAEDVDDDLYEEARQIVLEAGKASTSYIQRKLRVGYARAARLMDILEERGVIGPADGAKPRQVIDSSAGHGESDDAAGESGSL